MLVIILPSTAGEWMLMLLLLLARKTDSQDLIEVSMHFILKVNFILLFTLCFTELV